MKARLTNNPADREAAEELTRLNQNPPHFSSKDAFDAENKSAESPGSLPARTAAELYATHCEVCHGATGDGHGPSARHLFPRPRDLRSGTLRLVSTRNGVPTLEDLEEVLLRGMPGSSMPSFKDLSETDRELLAQEVLRLRREGVREQVLRALRQEGEEGDEAEVRRTVQTCTTPAERVRVPQNWPDSAQAPCAAKRASYRSVARNATAKTGAVLPARPCLTIKASPPEPATWFTNRSRADANPSPCAAASSRGCRALLIRRSGV